MSSLGVENEFLSRHDYLSYLNLKAPNCYCRYFFHNPEQRQENSNITIKATMANILIIDDDKMICTALESVISPMGHNVSLAYRLKEGLKKISQSAFDVVFLDVRLPDGNGLEVLGEIRETPSSPDVIIITGEGDPDGAEIAIKNGAWDYLQKPLSLGTVSLTFSRIIQYRQVKETKRATMALKRDGIIGDSSKLKHCLDLVSYAATTDASILITGETGTGKELFAKAVHKNSRRERENFVVVDCAALPDKLIESMLFGHVKGAFTGAERSREGLIKQADGGTLFLDEVGELPMTLQKAFLRALQEHRFRPVGGKREVESNFRLVTATNRDLEQMVETGMFRKELLFRIRATNIDLPPLRERQEDIKAIGLYYTSRICDRREIGTKGFSQEFIEALMIYGWPGNVRELVNALEEAISMAHNELMLFPIHLPVHIRIKLARASVSISVQNHENKKGATQFSAPFSGLRVLLETTEQQYLHNIMSLTKGDIKEVCKISGLSRSRLYSRLKKYNIQRKF